MTRRTALPGLWAAALLATGAVPAVADDVLLRGGGRVSGIIVERTDRAVVVETGPGRVTLLNSRIERIVSSRSPLETWRERAARLHARDTQGWVSLARFAEEAGLTTQARDAWERVLDADARHAEAHRALGHVLHDGNWLEEDAAYRARGYVRAEGRWMSPTEHEALVRDRLVQEESERERAEAAMRVREAEARAREAEARAVEAESGASNTGIPIWWGGSSIATPPRHGAGHRHGGRGRSESTPPSPSRPGAYQPMQPRSIEIPPGGPVTARPSSTPPSSFGAGQREPPRNQQDPPPAS